MTAPRGHKGDKGDDDWIAAVPHLELRGLGHDAGPGARVLGAHRLTA
ncbi:hypothetical protein [Streptomyces pactum]|nr:hypothetical protein [Streptomyces pactum]